MSDQYFIIENEDGFAVIKSFNVGMHIFSRLYKSELTLEEAEQIVEDMMPAMAAGAGHVAGIGIGPQGEPGVPMKNKRKVLLSQLRRVLGLT